MKSIVNNTEEIRKKLDRITIDREMYNRIVQDRTDFAFDSIYFRYAIARDELARVKAQYESHNWETEKKRADADKEHFYKTLEQWTQAHERFEI